MSDRIQRRGYLDWMRGLAVLIMIASHVLDAWTRVDARDGWVFRWAMIGAGFGAPLFLFLAGIAIPLSAGSKLRRTGDAGAASRAVVRRGFWVFGLAFLFRVQAWVLGWAPARTLLKVDILNIMGPSIAAAGALWGAFRSPRARGGICRGHAGDCVPDADRADHAAPRPPAGSGRGLHPPDSRAVELLHLPVGRLSVRGRPDWRAARQRSRARRGSASPDSAVCRRSGAGDRRLRGIVSPNSLHAVGVLGGSPAFFLLRTGVITAALAIAYVWNERRSAVVRWSPVQQLGRSSLFIYWIHVEMVYGLISLPLHKSLSFGAAGAALAAFAVFMLVCSIVKDLIVAWWSGRTPPSESLITESLNP